MKDLSHPDRPGHLYELENFETTTIPNQKIQFIEKEISGKGFGDLKTLYNGTTNEEVLKMLIDRLEKMGKRFPCRENSIAITHIETALLWLNKRTAERKVRGVEGKALA